MVAIHGGVIEIDNKAVIFTGDRGAGKSTLTTALREKGYKFICDFVGGETKEINRIVFESAVKEKGLDEYMDENGKIIYG